ncbi:MAG: transporter [Flavobacteriales bacterium]|nr:transporter [Flavobacteriales bacterium]|tara:strand:+ start:1526 stop:4084 length:2559 start_codon:yes stop_codon:yes gene_type:complete
MWNKISHIILRYRVWVIIILIAITSFLASNLGYNKVSYDLSRLLPVGDSTSIIFKEFKQTFGVNDNIYLVSTEDSNLYNLSTFQKYYDFSRKLQKEIAVDSVFSVANFSHLKLDKQSKTFKLKKAFERRPEKQYQIDSALYLLKNQPFYEGILYLPESSISLLAIAFNPDSLVTVRRNKYVLSVTKQIEQFSEENNLKFNYSGMPFIRAKLSSQVRDEILLFIGLAFGLTALLLYFFLRAPRAVFVSLLIVSVGVVWLFGSLGLLNRLADNGYFNSLEFNINILTSLVPPLVIVIGIPNCIFLINKYFDEYRDHNNQALALKRVIQKIGGATFMTNITTASGFATFIFASSDILKEFGIIASISIMGVFIISILLLPIIYSYLSPPHEKHYKHLDYKWTNALIEWFVNISKNYRGTVYVVMIFIAGTAGFGLSQLDNDALVVDDMPEDHPVMVDLKYYESNFNGVVPFEIILRAGVGEKITLQSNDSLTDLESLPFIKYIDSDSSGLYTIVTKTNGNYTQEIKRFLLEREYAFTNLKSNKIRGKVLKPRTLKKVQKLYDLLDTYDEFSRPLSMLDVLKYSKQALWGGEKKEFTLPTKLELGFINQYASKSKDASSEMLNAFVSKDGSQLRISLKMKDIGTNRTKSLMRELAPKIEKIFKQEKFSYSFTGIGVIVAKGVETLISNLVMSLLLTVIIISILMGLMFKNIRMVLISLLPNILPLFITAAIMGYLGINLKPSTILVFSIAFGISIDDTIHFLVKYRQELNSNNGAIKESVISALRETGLSMFYTSVVLFFGFGIFIASEFGGTVALGLLVALTLLVAMLSNLILLPCLLLTLDKLIAIKAEKVHKY